MADTGKQSFGEGSDNLGYAMGQMAKTAKSAQTAATATAAKATVEGVKAATEIATGTAVGGPVGTAISAAWSMRHTLFKVLIFVCLFLLFWIVLLASLPTIISNYMFGTDTTPPAQNVSVTSVYTDLEQAVSSAVELGYNTSFTTVSDIISNSGYDYELSIQALINYGQSSAGYDTAYILSAYSVATERNNITKDDMIAKLNAVSAQMFPVTYVEKWGSKTVSTDEGTTTITVKYAECTIHPFDNNVIHQAFNINPSAEYNDFDTTYGEVISNMALSLKKLLYGSVDSGQSVPLTDAELVVYVTQQGCTGTRKLLLETALSLVGKVPYFWGGKSAPGWNDEWNTPKLVTSAGSPSTGTIRPYGLDCSGFTSWIYSTAIGTDIGAGTSGQYPNTNPITEADLQIGDLGFLAGSVSGSWNHVLMFAGYKADGTRMWVHSSSGSGVILNTPDYESQLVLRRPKNVAY